MTNKRVAVVPGGREVLGDNRPASITYNTAYRQGYRRSLSIHLSLSLSLSLSLLFSSTSICKSIARPCICTTGRKMSPVFLRKVSRVIRQTFLENVPRAEIQIGRRLGVRD